MLLRGRAVRNRKGHCPVEGRRTYCSVTENSKHGFRLRRTEVTRAGPQEPLPSQGSAAPRFDSQSSLSAGMMDFCFSDSILPAQGPQEKGGSFSSMFPTNLLGLTAADDLDESPLGPNSCTFPKLTKKSRDWDLLMGSLRHIIQSQLWGQNHIPGPQPPP